MIWFDKSISVNALNQLGKNSMGDYLGILFTELGENYLEGTMPVDHRTKQPYGLLHGGASCVLAETLGSVGSAMVVNSSEYKCVGLEINANHIGSVTEGIVTGRATAIHLGRSTHVWEVRIYKALGKLICISRLTVAVMPLR